MLKEHLANLHLHKTDKCHYYYHYSFSILQPVYAKCDLDI
ncbi:hypothetical protein FHS70_003010 [Flammeovirga yaeyamensis]|nr:hypothetical protein [Flammeovirga yaeyamensis]